jgi:hypothetical protein
MFIALWPQSRADGGRTREAKVALEQREVEGVDHGVPCEVRPAVVPRLSLALAEGALEDAEVESVYVPLKKQGSSPSLVKWVPDVQASEPRFAPPAPVTCRLRSWGRRLH